MNPYEFRIIPGYENYEVSQRGDIKSRKKDVIVKKYLLNGYLIVDTFYDSKTETLPVHRAVALAWVFNENPSDKIIVNHKDGDKLNNWCENLEWVTYSENNHHAVDTGLRNDNIKCKVRDFITGIVTEFSSMRKASVAMGLSEDTPACMLLPKKFGFLINKRYEFKYSEDSTPWFYENRKEKINPSRYMILVKENDGCFKEVYSTRDFLKGYQLYKCPYGRSIPGLVKYANETYIDKCFIFRDSYAENIFRIKSNVARKPALSIKALRGSESITFPSLTRAAKYFNVDRSTIVYRLDKNISLGEWVFTYVPA